MFFMFFHSNELIENISFWIYISIWHKYVFMVDREQFFTRISQYFTCFVVKVYQGISPLSNKSIPTDDMFVIMAFA